MSHSEQSLPLINFQNVSFSYKNSSQEILKEVNVSFKSHAFYFLTGNSGMGKTSFLKLIYNALKPTSGSISVLGVDTKTLNMHTRSVFRQQIGIVLQDCELFEHLNAQENVALVLKLQGYNPKKANAYAEELLDWVGLGDCLKRFSNELSEGQKQRVAVARAVIRKPKILIADEPTGNVDEAQSKRLMNLFEELVKMGTTVVVATHNRQLVASKEYYEYHLKNGEIRKINSFREDSCLNEQFTRTA